MAWIFQWGIVSRSTSKPYFSLRKKLAKFAVKQAQLSRRDNKYYSLQ